jgi:hypothetical protein
MDSYPPQPRLTLSIGVIGHRPNRLVEAAHDEIRSEVERVIELITHEVGVVHKRYEVFFSGSMPQLCLVSALAEGADRIVAKAALAEGFVLDVPIPFVKDEYAGDFRGSTAHDAADLPAGHATSSSLDEFNALTADDVTRSLLQLPGNRSDAHSVDMRDTDKAYEMAGLTVIGQADILLTVWDGGPSAGVGGTTDMLHQAVRRGVPIIEINTAAPRDTRIRWSRLRESPIAAEQITDLPAEPFNQVLPKLIEEFLRPPSTVSERKALLSYLGDRPSTKRGWRRAIELYRDRFGTRERFAASATSRARQYQELMQSVAEGDAGSHRITSTLLAEAFGWADVMAIRFAKNFRLAYWFNFLMSAAAVIAALTSLLFESRWALVVEVVLIVLVVGNTVMGRRFGWHMRWMEAREIAERMRVAILFWLLGAQPPAFFGEEPAWTGWYARAVIREQGMRRGCLDRNGMSAARAAMLRVLEHQHEYHHENARKMKWRENWLEWIGLGLFSATLLIAVAHVEFPSVLECLFQGSPRHNLVLIMLSAILPTLATASYGIRVIGDFEGISKRSERAAQAHLHVIEALRRDPSDLVLFRARAQNIADAMLGDVASWRLSAESRGLAIPG